MKEVIPGIYQLPLPFPLEGPEHINSYLVQGNNGHLLIDTGWNTDESLDSLKKQLAEGGINLEDISQIVITHIHPDHYGLTGRLKQLSQAKIFLHYLEKDLIETRYIKMGGLLEQLDHWLRINGVITDELPQLQTASLKMAEFVAYILPDIILRGGETISTGLFSFQIIWTPGHSPGHICLYEPAQKILISGDHILPTTTPNVGLHPQSTENPLGDYLKSINAIKELNVKLVLPGHETPFTGLKSRINELIERHKRRNSEILQIIRAKPETSYQISIEIASMSGASDAGWQKLAPIDKRLAVLETIAHLESMRAEGKVSKLRRNNTTYYQPHD